MGWEWANYFSPWDGETVPWPRPTCPMFLATPRYHQVLHTETVERAAAGLLWSIPRQPTPGGGAAIEEEELTTGIP